MTKARSARTLTTRAQSVSGYMDEKMTKPQDIYVTMEQLSQLHKLNDRCILHTGWGEWFDEEKWEVGVVEILGFHPGRTWGLWSHRLIVKDESGIR